jgi:uncharacterized protein (TIGR02118 family)
VFKAIIFLKRRGDLSREAFRRWWLIAHRPLAEKLPGLAAHSFNLLPEGAPYDAVVEQYFHSHEAMTGCYDSEAGRAVAADSAGHISERLRLVVEAHDFEVASGAP